MWEITIRPSGKTGNDVSLPGTVTGASTGGGNITVVVVVLEAEVELQSSAKLGSDSSSPIT
jgi:hypothetical protein